MTRHRHNVDLARSLRKNTVPAEAVLWEVIRNRGLGGFKFRRQYPIGSYIADFICVECTIVVEIDGESHLSRKAEDEERSRYLESEGWLIMRFWNTEVYDEIESVKEAIYRMCLQRKK